ncbi:MAG TPA: type II toxin-antitoxin system prevent-host-death family antitoxin [Candidatus Acidoferrales bacterium]|nr:type II toxin-antitoxin system prevent-host-death family antitoxin [Candidatus Acidoferrales bacterium]
MKAVSAKELKNKTGEVLRRVAAGEKVLVTKRGKPYALISPVEDKRLLQGDVRPYETAWDAIEKKLKRTKPRHKTWQEAVRWSRRQD